MLAAPALASPDFAFCCASLQILDCLDLPAEYRSLLTTDDLETNLHAGGYIQIRLQCAAVLVGGKMGMQLRNAGGHVSQLADWLAGWLADCCWPPAHPPCPALPCPALQCRCGW